MQSFSNQGRVIADQYRRHADAPHENSSHPPSVEDVSDADLDRQRAELNSSPVAPEDRCRCPAQTWIAWSTSSTAPVSDDAVRAELGTVSLRHPGPARITVGAGRCRRSASTSPASAPDIRANRTMTDGPVRRTDADSAC